MSDAYFQGGAAESCATIEQDQGLAERCGQNRPIEAKGEFSASPAPMITGYEPRAVRVSRAIAIIKAIGQTPAPESLPPLRHTERSGDQNAPGFIYFAYCAGRIKIGYTTDVGERMRGIATSSPFPVTLLLTIPGTPDDERSYQHMFAEDRRHLEWFDLSYGLLDFLSASFACGTHELLWNAEDEFDEASALSTPPVWIAA